MAFIYKILNCVNGKCYIGKTLKTVEERWKQHIRSIYRTEYKNRPLYRAFKKYGISAFIIEQIEECSDEIANEREIYWIDLFGSYKKGYNATLGGDGKAFVDKGLIKNLWDAGKTVKEIMSITSHDHDTVKRALNSEGITKDERVSRGRLAYVAKPVLMYSKQGEYLKEFASTAEANKYVGIKGRGHISAVCNGKRKSCYGYVWKWK